ncbi:Uncharacterized protein C6F6.19 [Hypsizygus marmoreus]|uniref:Uncharacterized protein C6F6.19 n=1 Tax=Hypsizygus marmoreus TaxID=39966 RepID=A0A369JMN8_HYPMA|nr:Uncharacterized protein C6F6.19 [Hypsizygus marmoreus]
MSGGELEEDYLSDKFLVDAGSSSSAPKTYAQIRKEAERKAKLKNEQNRLKSRRQRELESREEGLSKSLFERAKEEEASGIVSSGSKALSIMMKMGFTPGQSLGKAEEPKPVPPAPSEPSEPDDGPATSTSAQPASTEKGKSAIGHTTEPIPLSEWGGKKGIGLGKRARSPTSAERVAKMAKMAKVTEEASHRDYRDRARQEYEERRAEGKLGAMTRCLPRYLIFVGAYPELPFYIGPAQRTCVTLDEQAGKSFHVLWLNPNNPDTFPPGLLDALTLRDVPNLPHEQQGEPVQVRLRRQMKADALQPLEVSEGTTLKEAISLEIFSSEVVDEAIQFLRLQAQDRLHLVLSYLRDNYAYCFWCGIQYDDQEAMENQCPGPDEESHD